MGTTVETPEYGQLGAAPACEFVGRSPAPLRPGARIRRYELIAPLGLGGMGIVFSARDPELDRTVAIKVLRASKRRSPSAAARLVREAQAIAQLCHPNVVQVYDVGLLEGGSVFIAMEHIQGEALSVWLERQPRRWEEVLDVLVRAGRGLAAAHAAGIVHRDFKLENVLVDKHGRVRVLDFGLARLASACSMVPTFEDDADRHEPPGTALSEAMTRDGVVMGTPMYMSPEQHAGLRVGPAGDQFAFCVALYRALFKRYPYKTASVPELAETKQRGPIRPVRGLVPRRIVRAVRRGLAVHAESRWRTMEDLLCALQRPRRRTRVLGGMVAALTTLAIAGSAGMGPTAEQRCDPTERLETLWGPAQRDGVEHAMATARGSHGERAFTLVRESVDRYLDGWRREWMDACLAIADGPRESPVLDRRIDCLERRADGVQRLVAGLSRADAATGRNAVDAATSLTPVSRCKAAALSSPHLRPPEDPAVAARVAQLRSRVEALTEARLIDRLTAGVEEGKLLVAEAEALGYPPLRAEALAALGRLQAKNGDYPSAVRNLEAAALLGQGLGDDVLTAGAAAELVYVIGDRQQRFERAVFWARHAEAAIDRLGGDPVLRAGLLNNLGNVFFHQRRLETARELFEHAIAMVVAERGAAAPVVGKWQINLANVLAEQGDGEGALTLYESAHANLVAGLGPDHPLIPTVAASIGLALGDVGRNEESRARLAVALDAFEAIYPDGHPRVAITAHNLGHAVLRLGRLDEADAYFQRGFEAFEIWFGADHPNTGAAAFMLGHVAAERGEDDRARTLLRRALEIRERAFGPDHPEVVEARDALARV